MPRVLVHPLEQRDDHLRGDEVVARQPGPVSLDVASRLYSPAFEDLLRGYGIVELQRTGRVALPKLEREARLRAVKGKAV